VRSEIIAELSALLIQLQHPMLSLLGIRDQAGKRCIFRRRRLAASEPYDQILSLLSKTGQSGPGAVELLKIMLASGQFRRRGNEIAVFYELGRIDQGEPTTVLSARDIRESLEHLSQIHAKIETPGGTYWIWLQAIIIFSDPQAWTIIFGDPLDKPWSCVWWLPVDPIFSAPSSASPDR
jgi:hypothetical protein